MSKILPPPITAPIVIDKEGFVDMPWVLFFNQVFEGDTGTSFTPSFTNLTSVGTPTFTGVYYKIGPLCYFRIVITPGTNTSSTSGTTYCDLPIPAQGSGVCFATYGTAAALGAIDSASGRSYPPSWTTITAQITLIGIYEA